MDKYRKLILSCFVGLGDVAAVAIGAWPEGQTCLIFGRYVLVKLLMFGLFMNYLLFNPQHTTVELQWLKHLWNHENMFETRVVRANEC